VAAFGSDSGQLRFEAIAQGRQPLTVSLLDSGETRHRHRVARIRISNRGRATIQVVTVALKVVDERLCHCEQFDAPRGWFFGSDVVIEISVSISPRMF
jgi:hypothetical protein